MNLVGSGFRLNFVQGQRFTLNGRYRNDRKCTIPLKSFVKDDGQSIAAAVNLRETLCVRYESIARFTYVRCFGSIVYITCQSFTAGCCHKKQANFSVHDGDLYPRLSHNGSVFSSGTHAGWWTHIPWQQSNLWPFFMTGQPIRPLDHPATTNNRWML